MKNIELLFKYNSHKNKVKLQGGTLYINIRPSKEANNIFSGEEIATILSIVNGAHERYGKLKFTIILNFGHIEFVDKLTYVFVECICYYLIKFYGHPVQLYMDVLSDIVTSGITSSPLLLLSGTSNNIVKKFPGKFVFDIYGYHYRRLVSETREEDDNYLGILYEEIDRFLKPFSIDEDCRDEIALVITELIGNACEHAKADCLIDIDVTPDYMRIDEEDNESDDYYYGVNIAVVNFSNILLGDGIHNNILCANKQELDERYLNVFKAYDNHSVHFSNAYSDEDFRNITTFQRRISGRKENFATGGTGLTKLIKSLQDKSDTYKCYVISGNSCINFYKEFLEYNDDDWIGFNSKSDYLNEIPAEDVVSDCLINMPGTAYNLTFVMKGEKI